MAWKGLGMDKVNFEKDKFGGPRVLICYQDINVFA